MFNIFPSIVLQSRACENNIDEQLLSDLIVKYNHLIVYIAITGSASLLIVTTVDIVFISYLEPLLSYHAQYTFLVNRIESK